MTGKRLYPTKCIAYQPFGQGKKIALISQILILNGLVHYKTYAGGTIAFRGKNYALVYTKMFEIQLIRFS